MSDSPKPSLQAPTHFRSYSSLRSASNSDEEAYILSPLNRENSRTHLQSGAEEADLSHQRLPPHLPMAYPPAGPHGPHGASFHSLPLNDAPERHPQSGRSTPVHFAPRPTVIATGSHSTMASVDEKRGPKSGTPSTPSRRHSFDAFAEAEAYNPAAANNTKMRFADGDAGTNAFSRFYLWLLDRGIVVRWMLFIVPVVILLWIPGIVDYALTAGEPNRKIAVWGVSLRWWSIWLSVTWLSLWASKAFFMIFPAIFRQTVATIIPSLKAYTPVVANLGKFAKFLIWAVVMNVSFTPLVYNNQTDRNTPSPSRSSLDMIRKLLLGFIFCMAVLIGEKLIIQLIAFAFHRDAYADRLAEQKQSVNILTALYIRSKHIPGTDIGDDASSVRTKSSQMPKVVIRRALRGLKSVAQSTTTALGNVASEMAGSSVLQTNSPVNKVRAAITSANKSKALARRLYYSFRAPGADYVTIDDIKPCFNYDEEKSMIAFNIFDRDGNGDATRDEMDAALLELHRERMALEASIRDLDGAVMRLDEILILVVLVIDILILITMTGAADQKLNTWVSSASTFILSISWMIGTTTQEILLACIFVFVKHPYDVGDRVDIDGNSYTVAKVELLSTAFKRVDGKYVWIGHNILSTKVIENVRRSGPTSETYTFDVAFDTTFDQLQALREKMLRFCKENARDFQPAFDVTVADMPNQTSMILKADIKYKSNWQLGALKVQRRNKWICQLKIVLMELKIWGPGGAGNPDPAPADPTRYTEVPWADVAAADAAKERNRQEPPPTFDVAMSGLHSRHDSTTDLFDTASRAVRNPALDITPLPTPIPRLQTHPGAQGVQVQPNQGYFPAAASAGVTGYFHPSPLAQNESHAESGTTPEREDAARDTSGSPSGNRI